MNASEIESVTVDYQNSLITQSVAAQVLFGAVKAKRKLPVSAGKYFPAGDGITTKTMRRLGYGTPESVGINGQTLRRMDSVVDDGLKDKLKPGAHIAMALGGKIN